jgi:hypothetical protein
VLKQIDDMGKPTADEDTLHFLIKCNVLYTYRMESMKELKDSISDEPVNHRCSQSEPVDVVVMNLYM